MIFLQLITAEIVPLKIQSHYKIIISMRSEEELSDVFNYILINSYIIDTLIHIYFFSIPVPFWIAQSGLNESIQKENRAVTG